MKELIKAVRKIIIQHDSLRKKPWRGNKNPLIGHCYVASEAIYHLLGGKQNGWTPVFIKHEGSPHWFLRKNGVVVDVTKDQFKTKVPYERGIPKGFLTKEPSRRAKELIRLLNDEY